MNQDLHLSRRDFIKLLGSAGLSLLASPHLRNQAGNGTLDSGNRKPNILILVFDTLSARHMSLHGYPRATTPNIARFAERACVYHNHYAAGNFTSPGTASLLTGVYPWQHRAVNLNGIVSPEFRDRNIFSLLNPQYHTAAYTHNPLAGIFLQQFADHIDQYHPMRELSRGGEVYSDRIGNAQFPIAFWSETLLRGTDQFLPGSLLISSLEKEIRETRIGKLEARLKDKYPLGIAYNFKGMHFLLEDVMSWIYEQVLAYPQPYLAYYHLWPPHDPYRPSAEFIDIFNDGEHWPAKPLNEFSQGEPEDKLHRFRQEYDEYLAYVDFEFGRLLENLDRDGVLENTLLVITSDHGELFERGLMGHLNSTLYQDLLQVPLLISLPGQVQRFDFFSPTSCIDLLPTILWLTGQEIPEFLEGEVLPGFMTESAPGTRSIYALEAKLSSKQDPTQICTAAMISGSNKLIRYLGYEDKLDDELYDLAKDPEEMDNLAAVNKGLATEMGVKLNLKLDRK